MFLLANCNGRRNISLSKSTQGKGVIYLFNTVYLIDIQLFKQ